MAQDFTCHSSGSGLAGHTQGGPAETCRQQQTRRRGDGDRGQEVESSLAKHQLLEGDHLDAVAVLVPGEPS